MGKREENRRKKQQAIVQAALAVFARNGYASTTVSEVARVAGVGKGTIYEYYQSKEDLFFGVFEWYVEMMVASGLIQATEHGGDAAEHLRAFLDSALSSAIETMEYFAISLEFWAAAGNPATRDRFRAALQDLYDSFRTVIQGIIEDGLTAGAFHSLVNPEAVAAGLVGALDGLMLQAWMDPSFDIRATAEGFLDTIINGMHNRR